MYPLTGALPWRLMRTPEGDEAALVTPARWGEEAALVDLYERHASCVLAYLRHLTNDAREAEELFQDTFVVADWRAARHFGRRSSVRTWLLGIARRRARDRRRRADAPSPGRLGTHPSHASR